jgi:hypothetical protein
MPIRNRPYLASVLALVGGVSFIGCGLKEPPSSSTDGTVDIYTLPLNQGRLFVHDGYDYAPSMIDLGNGTQQFWWCGGATGEGLGDPENYPDGADVVYYRTKSAYGWSAVQLAITPTFGSWDGTLVCDPSVVRGSFVNPQNGITYGYAMYYTGTNLPASHAVDNRVGLAFSNNGVNWLKYSQPVVTPGASSAGYYGAGQPSTYNSDGQAGVWLFYTDTPNGQERIFVRKSTNGINYGSRTLISNNGPAQMPLGGMANSDIVYDHSTGLWYAALSRAGRGDRETYRFGLYRMTSTNLFAGTGTWEGLGEINSDLTGWYLNHSPGLRRDQYGNLTAWLPSVTMYFSSGTGQQNIGSWDLASVNWSPSPSTLALKRYYSTTYQHHWVTTGWVGSGYAVESTLGYLQQAPVSGTRAIYSCQANVGAITISADHFLSLDSACEGQTALGITGFAYTSGASGRVALYRCRVPTNGDHFVSTNAACEGQTVENGGAPLGYAKTKP